MLATREDQVREDIERGRLDYAMRDFGLTEERLRAYGAFVAELVRPTHFITLTHDPRRLDVGHALLPQGRRSAPRSSDADRYELRRGAHHAPPSQGRIVGRQRHRRQVARWYFDDVRPLDPTARVYGEVELQKSGQAHEHIVGRFAERAPLLSIRDAWFRRAGYCDVRLIEGDDDLAQLVRSMYVAKYAGKSGAAEPFIAGFGLRSPSFAQVLR